MYNWLIEVNSFLWKRKKIKLNTFKKNKENNNKIKNIKQCK